MNLKDLTGSKFFLIAGPCVVEEEELRHRIRQRRLQVVLFV